MEAFDLPAAATWARLNTFVTVYDSGSVRAAAELLHVTAPAVSTSISALESALGVTLFTKRGRGIIATDAGETFAGYARKLLGLIGEAAGAVHEAERGRLRIGSVATASEYVLPPLISSFAQQHPRVQLSLSVLPRDELFALAADHAVDVVVAGRPPRTSGLTTRARRTNRLVVVGHPDNADDPLKCVWLLTERGSGTRSTALDLLRRLRAEPATLTLGTSGAAVAAAREGLGVTLVHEQAIHDQVQAGKLKVLPVTGTPLARPWHLCTADLPTAATRLFLSHVCSAQSVGAAAFHTRTRPPG